MIEKTSLLNRRSFLIKSTCFFAGTLFGINGFSKAFAHSIEKNVLVNKPKIALIIDDIGFSHPRLNQFLNLNIPITFAVLPQLKKSCVFGEEIQNQGHEVILHQPMEPFNSNIDPGPGALYVGDNQKKVIRTLEENIENIPFITGINNHMGSRFTSSKCKMREVLNVVKEKNLFFIDSLTSNQSAGYETAKKLDVVTACRNFFLDHNNKKMSILYQLSMLKRYAERYGQAIGIGHPYSVTVHALKQFLDNPNNSHISFVHVSHII